MGACEMISCLFQEDSEERPGNQLDLQEKTENVKRNLTYKENNSNLDASGDNTISCTFLDIISTGNFVREYTTKESG